MREFGSTPWCQVAWRAGKTTLSRRVIPPVSRWPAWRSRMKWSARWFISPPMPPVMSLVIVWWSMAVSALGSCGYEPQRSLELRTPNARRHGAGVPALDSGGAFYRGKLGRPYFLRVRDYGFCGRLQYRQRGAADPHPNAKHGSRSRGRHPSDLGSNRVLAEAGASACLGPGSLARTDGGWGTRPLERSRPLGEKHRRLRRDIGHPFSADLRGVLPSSRSQRCRPAVRWAAEHW